MLCSVSCMWIWLERIEGAKFKIQHSCNLKFNTNFVFKLEKTSRSQYIHKMHENADTVKSVQMYSIQDRMSWDDTICQYCWSVQIVEESQQLTSDWWLRQLRNEIVHHYNSSYVIWFWFLWTGVPQHHSPVREKTHPARTEKDWLDL